MLAAVLLTTACGESTAPAVAAAPATPAVFRYAMNEVPASFDPLRASSIYASTVVTAVHDTLYRYRYLSRPYVLAPSLAAALPEVSVDGLTWTIRLKSGVHFADHPAFADGRGREVVAADVVYSFQRHFQPDSGSEGSWLWQDALLGISDWQQRGADPDQPWQAVEAVDAHTVRFRLARPFPQLAHTLTQGFSAIVAREVVAQLGPDYGRHPVGSGPFRLQSFDGVVARFQRHSGFRTEPFDARLEGYDPLVHEEQPFKELDGRAPPFVDALEIHFLADDALKLASFQRGDLDLAPLRPAQVFAAGAREPDTEYARCCHVRLEAQNELLYLGFNMKDPHLGRGTDPTGNERGRALRCAIGLAYDWQARNRALHAGTGAVFRGHLPPTTREFAAIDRLDPLLSSADPVAARALLTEHGWHADNLPVLRFASTAGTEMQQVFELLRANLLAIGWPAERIEWQSYPTFGAFLAAVNAGQTMLMDLGWHLDYPDALNALQLFYGPYAPPQVNAGAYVSERFDAWYSEAQGMPTEDPRRQDLVRRMDQQLREDCASVAGFARSTLSVWRRDALVWPDELLGGHLLWFVARMPAMATAPPP